MRLPHPCCVFPHVNTTRLGDCWTVGSCSHVLYPQQAIPMEVVLFLSNYRRVSELRVSFHSATPPHGMVHICTKVHLFRHFPGVEQHRAAGLQLVDVGLMGISSSRKAFWKSSVEFAMDVDTMLCAVV